MCAFDCMHSWQWCKTCGFVSSSLYRKEQFRKGKILNLDLEIDQKKNNSNFLPQKIKILDTWTDQQKEEDNTMAYLFNCNHQYGNWN